ncbi:immunoglobulin-like domain-containing protein [Domibacillus epiphyticus]|uniref:Bacterial Ig-like domain-containing protein n=1 Tax=Domibacillus epiphyticus TaxID=1714355 RepID=A0A1V2A7P2_9BACI|nr:immunoglobulin-like domain-containing protein [Domibacillus epiphyticus]OMP66967.1 hypothetical protein BTO28_09535 [Domibacillus epiphyticus]
MKYNNIVLFSTLFSILMIVSACQSTQNLSEKATQQEIPNTKNGVILTTEKEEYKLSTEEITIKIENKGTFDFESDISVSLQKKVDGIWYEIPHKEQGFSEVGIGIIPGETDTLEVKLDDYKYKFNPGEYRVVQDGLAAPFEITNS